MRLRWLANAATSSIRIRTIARSITPPLGDIYPTGSQGIRFGWKRTSARVRISVLINPATDRIDRVNAERLSLLSCDIKSSSERSGLAQVVD